MAKDSYRCSVVIRAFNEERHLERLLKEIQSQTVKDVEIILVDSGSTDRTLEIAARYPVKVVPIRPEEFTFGRSLNQGIEATSAELIVIASAHVYPLGDDWLEKLLEPFADEQVALSYGKQRGAESSKFSEDQHFRRWFHEDSDFDQPHAFSNNANAAIRKSLWLKNPYDENLTGLEDIAWSSWAVDKGYKIAYVAEAAVVHLHHESAAQIINRHRREAVALKSILPQSDFSLWNFAGLYLRALRSDFRAARQQGVLLRNFLGILSFRFLQYLGTYRGYRDARHLTPELKQVYYYPPGLLEERRQADSDAASKYRESTQNSV